MIGDNNSFSATTGSLLMADSIISHFNEYLSNPSLSNTNTSVFICFLNHEPNVCGKFTDVIRDLRLIKLFFLLMRIYFSKRCPDKY